MTVRVRGIYATALTRLFGDAIDADGAADPVVQVSPAIDDRFSDREFPVAPAAVTVDTTDDRQGVGLVGEAATVADALAALADVGRDAFVWRDPTPRGAVFDGEVTETLGSGAVVDLGLDGDGAAASAEDLADYPTAATDGTGFLPFGTVDRRIDEGNRVRVQVTEPAAPWSDDRPVLDTQIRVERPLVTLVRGGVADTGGAHLGDVLPTDPAEGWGVRWGTDGEEAGLDALDDALTAANERAGTLDDAMAGAEEDETGRVADGRATAWVWFGRESRFALDDVRRSVTPTMPGHHRTKAGADAASAAVDFVEAMCSDLDEADFPFGAITNTFGPREGDRVAIHHGKPDGRLIDLGRASVTSVEGDGTVEIERELASSGTYDGLGTERERGDVATTKLVEGRWWYPTTYRSADGELRGTYVNVCTPVEVFPRAVRYVDLHVDVVKRPDGTVERVDDDELDAAAAEGVVSEGLAEKARTVAAAVERAL